MLSFGKCDEPANGDGGGHRNVGTIYVYDDVSQGFSEDVNGPTSTELHRGKV